MPTELHRRELDTYLALSHLRAALALLPEDHPRRAGVAAVAAEFEAHWRTLEAQIVAAAQAAPAALRAAERAPVAASAMPSTRASRGAAGGRHTGR